MPWRSGICGWCGGRPPSRRTTRPAAAAGGEDGATIAVMAVMAIVAVLASGLLACWRLDGGDMDWSVVTAPWLSAGLLFLVLLVASIEDAVEAIRARRTR